jgi:hypothetical protein
MSLKVKMVGNRIYPNACILIGHLTIQKAQHISSKLLEMLCHIHKEPLLSINH